MKIHIDKTNEEVEKKFEGTVKRLLETLNINSEEVLVIRDDTLITEDVELSDNDTINILSVVSGG
ncbi:hypothetical protein HOD20_02005 [archaeon]|jgi:sulfur carrier protein ThiS|nr:hypothetical protein [archaeon]MBT4648228.1 hypothetical protein [archaeon]MBT6822278.1 hypothetical protein [archaeon]MBT7392652.1 hypothetical protein [archaeon]